jgi:hypothetical protein
MPTEVTLVAPTCACCPSPATLLPRDDLPGGLAACPASGRLYRPDGPRWVPAVLPPLASDRPAPSVRVDLSSSGYA